MPLSFSETLPSPLRCRLSFTCENERWPNYYWPDANIHTNTATGNTQRRHEPKVTRIIVSSPAVVQQGWYLSPWCHETCEKRVWLFLDIFSTPVPRVQWVGISNFITCHKRDTGCSGEHCSLSPTPPPPTLHPSTSETSHPVLGNRARKKKTKISPVGGCSRGQPTSILSSGS